MSLCIKYVTASSTIFQLPFCQNKFVQWPITKRKRHSWLTFLNIVRGLILSYLFTYVKIQHWRLAISLNPLKKFSATRFVSKCSRMHLIVYFLSNNFPKKKLCFFAIFTVFNLNIIYRRLSLSQFLITRYHHLSQSEMKVPMFFSI